MNTNKQKTILQDCIDQLTNAPFASTIEEKQDLAQTIIDLLADYPKTELVLTDRLCAITSAYLYTSTTSNIMKLAQLGVKPFRGSFEAASKCIEASLSLLTD